ncbi:MAG: hypothetical protein GX558_11585, partial [Clostridiales bacterium]|nr:hypothetical protein [Clostridiales bacterium]
LPLGVGMAAPAGERPTTYALRAGEGELTLDAQGAITGFSMGDTVFSFTERPLSAVSVLYDGMARSQWQARDWQELGPDAVSVESAEDGLALSYQGFGGQDISARLTIRVDEQGFRFDLSIENHAPGVVVGARMARLTGMTELGGWLYAPDRAGQRLAFPFKKLMSGPHEFIYPVPLSAQFVSYTTGELGWTVRVLDERMRFKRILVGDVFRQVEVEQYCFLEGGASGALPTVVLEACRGDWHLSADRYRAWFEGWSHRAQDSALLGRMPTISSAVIRARPEDDPTLRDVTRDQELTTYTGALERMAQLRRAGFEGCQLVGWHGTGHDTDYPLHEVAQVMGGPEGLRTLTGFMRGLGMQVGFYTNARLGNIKSPEYQRTSTWKIVPEADRNIRERYGGEWFDILCPAAPGFIECLADKAAELAGQYNADFVQLDQVGAARSYLCFDESHGHTSPADAWAEGYPRLIEAVNAAGRAHNPGFWSWCEGAWEGAGQYLQLQQGGFWPLHGESQYFPELYRYTFPDHPLMGDGWLGGVCMWVGGPDMPAVGLMKRHQDFYANARFMDTVGLAISGEGVRAKWHKAKRGVAVVARNDGSAAVEANLALDAGLAGAPQSLWAEDMTSGEVRAIDRGRLNALRVSLQPGEIGGVLLFW